MIPSVLASCLLAPTGSSGKVNGNMSSIHISAFLGVSPVQLTVGPKGETILTLRPEAGTHSEWEASVVFVIDPNSALMAAAPRTQNADPLSGSLLSELPVHSHITVRPGTKPRRCDFIATGSFSYCSDTEGWCRNRTDVIPFSLAIST
jgi:hypothetical protein